MQSPCNDDVTLKRLNDPSTLIRLTGRRMKDLIRSPLQFVRPMTDHEWQDLVLRAGHRERQQLKRRQPHRKPAQLEVTRRQAHLDRGLKRPASSASL